MFTHLIIAVSLLSDRIFENHQICSAGLADESVQEKSAAVFIAGVLDDIQKLDGFIVCGRTAFWFPDPSLQPSVVS